MGGLLPGQGGPAVTNGVAALQGYDLTQHDSQASYIFVSSIFFLILLPIIMAMRVFVRLRMVRALGADDGTIYATRSNDRLTNQHSAAPLCIRLRLRLLWCCHPRYVPSQSSYASSRLTQSFRRYSWAGQTCLGRCAHYPDSGSSFEARPGTLIEILCATASGQH